MTTSEVRMNDIFNNYDIKNVVPKPAPKSIRKTLTPLVNNIVFSVDKENKKSSLKKKSTSKTNKNNPIVSTHLKHRVEDFLISNEILSESSTTDSVSYKSSVASGRELRIDNKTEADTQTKSKYTREQLLKFVQNCYGDKKPIMCETEQNRLEDEMCLIEQRKQLLLSPEYKQDLVTTALAMDVNDCAKKSLQESKDARIERPLSKYNITDIYVPFKPKSNRGSPGGYISSRASSAQPPSSLYLLLLWILI